MLKRLLLAAAMPVLVCWGGAAAHAQDAPKSYVGNETCAQCHEGEYRRFTEYSKKHHSFQSIEKLRDGLTPQELQQCYGCHTTGFGQPGGFVDPVSTPAMKDLGCESCHGPGSLHVETEDPEHIQRDLTIQDCRRCHNEERVRAFNFQPLIRSGAH